MERTGGEPDVVGYDKKTGEYIFYDCSAESPSGRRSTCYDREALEARKEHKPKSSALEIELAEGVLDGAPCCFGCVAASPGLGMQHPTIGRGSRSITDRTLRPVERSA